MGIDWHRPEYDARLPDWSLVDDMCDEVKLGSHLPELNPTDKSEENKARNEQYRERASFFGASRVTVQSLIGTAFEKDPQITLPGEIDYLLKNADGSGADLWQLMQAATGQLLRKARCGLFVTMPPTGGNVSVADQEAGRFISTVHVVDARRIINWWTRRDGAETIIGGVVFTDTRETVEDYKVKAVETRRELALDDAGNFYDRTWIKAEKATGLDDQWIAEEPIYPTTGAGALWRRIPFFFLGAEVNSWTVQTPPMLSLARLNRDHFRNSADNEESLFYAGQVQPYIEPGDSGIAQSDIAALKASGFYVGSRQVIMGKFGFAQADANTALRQAMLDKELRMAALGARFVQPGEAAKTATQAAGEEKVEHSILSLISVNVEDGFQWACERVAEYMRASGKIEIKLNRSFMEPQVTAEKMREIRENVLSGLAPLRVMYDALQRSGDLQPEVRFEEFRDNVNAAGFGAADGTNA